MPRIVEHGCMVLKRVRVGLPAAGRLGLSRLIGVGTAALVLTLLSAGVVLAAAPGTWSLTASMAAPHPLATLLSSGQVLAVGGATAEVYNPATASWRPAGQPVLPPHATVLLANGNILAVAGTSAERYDPSEGTWTLTGAPVFPADGPLTLLPSGEVLSVGFDPSSPSMPSAQVYDPVKGSWRLTGRPLPGLSSIESTILLHSGKVLLIGSDPPSGVVGAQVYEPATGTWSATGSPNVVNLGGRLVIVLPNGEVLLAGSSGGARGSTGAAQLYNPTTGTWRSTGAARNEPDSLTLLGDGRVLAAGESFRSPGPGPSGGASSSLNVAELYEPAAGLWSTTGSLIDPEGRPGHTATLLPNGTVLAAGGGNTPTSAETYTPATPTMLPTSCALALTGKDASGQTFVRVVARDIASGLQSVQVAQATNATVSLPMFPLGSRDPAVVAATRLDGTRPSSLQLAVTTGAGVTVSCDLLMAQLTDQRHGNSRQVFTDLAQTQNKIHLTNGTPGLDRLDIEVNGQRFRLEGLKDSEERTVDVAGAMQPGRRNTIQVDPHGPHDSSAVLVISG